MKARFLAQIRRNLEAWRGGEIDYTTYSDWQRETWAAIRVAGDEIEAAVVCELTAAVQLADVGEHVGDDRRTMPLRATRRSEPRPEIQRYCGQLQRTAAGSLALHVAATDPRSTHAEYRQVAALIYELAADLERRSQQLEAHWTVSPDAPNSRVVIELTGDHETVLASELIGHVMARHDLT